MSKSNGGAQITFADPVEIAGDNATARCVITIDFEVPAGHQLSKPWIMFNGWATNTTLARTYRYQGEAQPFAAHTSTPDGRFMIVEAFSEHRTPTCSGAQTVRLIATFDAHVSSALDAFSLYSVNIETDARVSGVEWRACDDNSPAPLGGIGDECESPRFRPCSPELRCERDSRGPSKCVDPHAQVPAAVFGDPCGGIRGIACEPGLSCWVPDNSPPSSEVLGRCYRERAGLGEDCENGTPRLQCEDGLYCTLALHTCVAATGALYSLCGEGLPDCDEPLECVGSITEGSWQGRCLEPKTQCVPGSCPAGLYCWPRDQTCTAGDGQLYSPCGGELPECAAPLSCHPVTHKCSSTR